MFRFALPLAALALAASPVLAQSTSPGTSPSTSPNTTPAQRPAVTSPASPSGSAQWYAVQPDDMRASRMMGTTVRNSAGESVGDVNEIIIDKSGKVAAVVVGVGGFLGIGEREVALGYNQIQSRVDSGGNLVITTTVSRDELRTAPAIQRNNTAR